MVGFQFSGTATREYSHENVGEQNGVKSKSYDIALKNGRSYFYDAWQLPANFKNLQGKDVPLRFTDALGKTRTWRGDYREKVADDATAPPVFKAVQ